MKKMTVKMDGMSDKKLGIKENSAADMRQDKKNGVPLEKVTTKMKPMPKMGPVPKFKK